MLPHVGSYPQAEGYKVGLYTSPHLVDFRERIKVNGEMISEQEVIDFVEQERSFFEPLHPSSLNSQRPWLSSTLLSKR